MDYDSEYLEKIQSALKEETEKKKLVLYTDNKHQNVENISKIQYSFKDIISKVNSELKAIQKADYARSSKSVDKNMDKYKNSEILSVSQLPKHDGIHQDRQTNKFGTQCISDTQLINIAEDAEALIETHNGITQEFNTTFHHTSKQVSTVKSDTNKTEKVINDGETIFDSQYDEPFNAIQLIAEENMKPDKIIQDCNEEFNVVNKCIQINEDMAKYNIHSQPDNNFTQILNESIKTEPKISQMIIIKDKDNTPSPILNCNVKSPNATISTSPLVFNLEYFEKFEKIAASLIEENLDIETAKHVINSQIIGKELCLNTESKFHEENRFISEQFKVDDKKLHVDENSDSFSSSIQHKEDVVIEEVSVHRNNLKFNESFADAILFSSDEEEDFNKNSHELPLTCALETSFYDQPEVLDKTMYVGFQTASNKSIQVSTDSFYKAKTLLKDEGNTTHNKELTMTELVELCDSVTGNNKNISNTCVEDDCKIVKIVERDKQENNICSQSNESDLNKDNITDSNTKDCKELSLINKEMKPLLHKNKYDNEKRRITELNTPIFEGFKTASNKGIHLSKNALARCKKVFQDIDLNEPFDHQKPSTSDLTIGLISIEENFKNSNELLSGLSKVTCAAEVDNKDNQEMHTADNIEDENIIQEFECHEMLYTNTNMNGNSNEDTFKFVGFKTASNEDIVITADTPAKTKNIFLDILCFDDKKNLKIQEQFRKKNEREITSKIITDNYSIQTGYNINQEQGNMNMATQEQNFVGFKTASNKQINISQQALLKAKHIFQDIESIDYIDIKATEDKSNNEYNLPEEPSSSKASFPGFKTANNKEITISKEALMKSKNLFQDIDNEEFFERVKPSISKEHNTGFKTVNDKLVKSEENRAITMDSFYVMNEYLKRPSCNMSFLGFKTANNKEITISKEALLKSKNLFQTIDKEDFFDRVKPSTSKDHNSDFKSVNDKEQTFAKTGDILRNIDYEYFNQPSTSKGFSMGFKTANNKEIKISKQALARTKNIFQDIYNDNHNETTEYAKINKYISMGYKTASDKEVKFSDDAIAKSKRIFKDVLECHDENLNLVSNFKEKKYPSFQGFQSASSKSATISANALSKTKHIFQDIDIPMDVPNKELENNTKEIKNIDVSVKFQGFTTASNKQVTISDEALAISKKIFEGLDIERDFMCTDVEYTPFKGFPTSSNKISENSLIKTKIMFEDKESDICIKDISKFGKNYNSKLFANNLGKTDDLRQSDKENAFEFKTANNQTIKISEKALERSTKISTDSDAEKDIQNVSEKKLSIRDDIKTEINNISDDVNISNIINTQVLNDFDVTLYTEDFCKDVTANHLKRSGSPILSCPRAKKRKQFETPLRNHKKFDITINNPRFVNKSENVYIFKESYKKNKAYTLKELNKLEKEFSNKTQDLDLPKLKFNELLEFEFPARRNDLTTVRMTVHELKDVFLAAVDRKIVPDGWLDNHIKLILWKLFSYEIAFPNVMKNICTVKNVLEQLKYRYDRELHRVERPVLRKILEKDDTSLKTMVLCVVDIIETDSSTDGVTSAKNIELVVTDGWYCVKACIDRMLTKLVQDGKIFIGIKIVTNGAELLNCDQGLAPWEDTSSVRLKLFGNSTRRALWHCRLGYHGNAAMLTPLSTVKIDGGKVSKLRVIVTRVYPLLYVEKFEDGSTVTRSERLENIYQMNYETETQMLLEKIYEEVEKEFSDQDMTDSEMSIDTNNKRIYLESGSQIVKMMKNSKDPVEFCAHLTESQSKLLMEHKSKDREKLLQDIHNKVEEKLKKYGINIKRNVIPLLKIRIASVEERNGKIELTKGLMSIWKPNDAILEIIKEDVWIEVLNVLPTSVRYSEIHISAGRQSIFIKSKYKEKEEMKPYTKTLKRICYNLKSLVDNPTMNTDYNEIDTAAMIFHIDPSNEDFQFKKQPFQNVFVTDSEKNIICVNFWGGIKKFGFENVLNIGEIVACINLQKRAGNTKRSIPQFRATEFTYFTKSPKNDNTKLLLEELNKKFSNMNKDEFCEECLLLKNNFSSLKLQNNESISPYRFNNSVFDISKNSQFVDSPLPQKLNNLDCYLNLTAIDLESTFKQRQTRELSPNQLSRKKKVDEKIARLKMYGEPPPLSPMHIINKSKNAAKAYKSPLLITNDISDSVASKKENPPNDCTKITIDVSKEEDIHTSPALMNTKYEKRKSMNPVKLSFSNDKCNAENMEDMDFGEDFEISPPMSLD